MASSEITKINIECRKCREKLKRFLSKFQGVYSVKFDEESGRLTVTTPVDHHLFSEAVGHARFSAELMCEDALPVPPSQNTCMLQHKVNAPQDGVEIIRWAQMAELQKLPNFHKLKKLELTQSGNNRRIKLTFNDHKMDGHDHQVHQPQPHAKINTVKDDEHEPHHGGGSSNVNNGPNTTNAVPKNKTSCSSNNGDGHQGGEGSSVTSTCDGSSHHNFEFQYVHAPDGAVPAAAAGTNHASHAYLPPTYRDRVTVEHAALRCEDAIGSKCTIL